VVSMKGSPIPSSGAPWSNEPLQRFDKFSNSPSSAWHVGDGTLGTFLGQVVVDQKFATSLRGLEAHDVSTDATLGHPTWKSANTATHEVWRQPKRLRQGIGGGELGPAFVQ